MRPKHEVIRERVVMGALGAVAVAIVGIPAATWLHKVFLDWQTQRATENMEIAKAAEGENLLNDQAKSYSAYKQDTVSEKQDMENTNETKVSTISAGTLSDENTNKKDLADAADSISSSGGSKSLVNSSKVAHVDSRESKNKPSVSNTLEQGSFSSNLRSSNTGRCEEDVYNWPAMILLVLLLVAPMVVWLIRWPAILR